MSELAYTPQKGVNYVEARGKIIIDKTSGANSGTMFSARGAKIVIGKNVGIGHNCVFITSYGSHYLGEEAMKRKKDIIVKDNAWISYGVMVRGGVTIGKWSVVGMGSVVLSDVPDYMIAVGNPARIVGRRPDYDLIMKAIEEDSVPKALRVINHKESEV